MAMPIYLHGLQKCWIRNRVRLFVIHKNSFYLRWLQVFIAHSFWQKNKRFKRNGDLKLESSRIHQSLSCSVNPPSPNSSNFIVAYGQANWTRAAILHAAHFKKGGNVKLLLGQVGVAFITKVQDESRTGRLHFIHETTMTLKILDLVELLIIYFAMPT